MAAIRLIVTGDPPRKLHGATSRRLSMSERPSRPMLALAKAMLSEVGIGKRGTPADLVVVIDDVELDNVDREAVIVKHFQEALESQLEGHSL